MLFKVEFLLENSDDGTGENGNAEMFFTLNVPREKTC
jgi:hypothetical protein